MKLTSAIAIFICFISVTAQTNSKCSGLFDVARSNWRSHNPDLYTAFRANAKHFWTWVSKAPMSSVQESLLKRKGVGIGDAHIMNFGDIELEGGGRKFGLIDLDDVGSAVPFAGDILRLSVGSQLAMPNVKIKDLWNAYRLGLAGQKTKIPKFMKEIKDLPTPDFERRQRKYLNKILIDDAKFSEKSPALPLATAPKAIRDQYETDRAHFEEVLKGYRVLDIGYRVKPTGGSRDLPRFWYLLEGKDLPAVVEFKMMPDSAVKVLGPQESPKDLFEKVAKYYRGAKKQLGIYTILQAGPNLYLARQRFKTYLDIKVEEFADPVLKAEAEEAVIYFANRMGLQQIQQSEGRRLHEDIESGPDSIRKEFEDLVERYIEVLKENFDSEKKP